MKARIVKVSRHTNWESRRYGGPVAKFGRTRIYTSGGDNSQDPQAVWDIDPKVWKRHRRKSLAAIRTQLPWVLKLMGLDPETEKVSFSQKAGCDCGCSPGYICRSMSDQDWWIYYELYDYDQAEIDDLGEFAPEEYVGVYVKPEVEEEL